MDSIIQENHLSGTYAYLDDVTICGKTQEEHDRNVNKFMRVVEQYNLTLNREKCVFSQSTIRLLGYEIINNELRPDPDRLQSLKEMPPPQTKKSLSRMVGLFSYYSRWIPNFSAKIRPLINAELPLTPLSLNVIKELKLSIMKAVRPRIDENIPFTIETDASNYAIAATLNQEGRPVAFFSRSLNQSERNHSSIEKEAYAIVESVRKWHHYLIGRHFTLVTDQRFVSFMFDQHHKSKIKNEKILRWRIDLMPYSFDISYRPGKLNSAVDALSRGYCMFSTSQSGLRDLHSSLCHPGITRMLHLVRIKNLPYSVDDVKKVISTCQICSRVKPQFFQKENKSLIQAMRPFDRLSIDFKGPLPSSSVNKYLLVIVDEYSRFPFAFPCKDTTADTVIKCLISLFSVFGMPGYLHSDRGTSFMSTNLKEFLLGHGISTSRTTPYHPTGNGQCEKYVGLVWKTINLALQTKKLHIQNWEAVLPDALHSIRSLLCTATNTTPHERLFAFPRKTSSGTSIPSWLLRSDKVYLRKYIRNKDEPLVEEVELLEANPQYAHIKFSSGREDTVSIEDLAPSNLTDSSFHLNPPTDSSSLESVEEGTLSTRVVPSSTESGQPARNLSTPDLDGLRRSSRLRKPIDRLNL